MPSPGRQQHLERRAPVRLAVDLDGAAVAVDDAQHRRQAQTASLELRGEERLEKAFPRIGIHAAADVRNFEIDVFAGRQILLQIGGLQVGFDGELESGGQGDPASLVAHGLGGVGHQIHDHLADLGRVDLHGGQVVGQLVAQAHLLGDGRFEQLAHFPDHVARVAGC